MSRMDSNGYNLDFDRRMASAEDAWLEPPGELVDEDEEDAFDLSGWDEHRIVWSLYLQAVACAEAKSNDVAWIFNSMKLYRKGEKKAYIFDEFKEYRYYRYYATVCEEWIKHDKLGRLDELSFAETLF